VLLRVARITHLSDRNTEHSITVQPLVRPFAALKLLMFGHLAEEEAEQVKAEDEVYAWNTVLEMKWRVVNI
jgi:hypothetical protein